MNRAEILKLKDSELNDAVMRALGYIYEQSPDGSDLWGWRYLRASGGSGLHDKDGNQYALMVNPRTFPNFAYNLNAAWGLPLPKGVEIELKGGTGIEPRAKLVQYATGRVVAIADAHEPAEAVSKAWLLWHEAERAF